MNTKQFWVPDLVGKLLPACKGISELAAGYKHIAAADGVHLSSDGYEKVANCLLNCSKDMIEKGNAAAVSHVSAQRGQSRQRTFYWRGFASPIGSERPKDPQAAYLATHRGGGGKWRGHPVNVGHGRGRGGVNVGRGKGHQRPPPYFRRN